MQAIECFWTQGSQGEALAKTVYGDIDPSKLREGDEYLFARVGEELIGACRLSPEETGFSLRSMEVKAAYAR